MCAAFSVYDYINQQGKNEFREWSSKLQKTQRAKLNQYIDKLRFYGESLYPNTLTDSGIPGILKVRITASNVQLRPLLCRGPIKFGEEYTLLLGAKEVGSEWKPEDAPLKAKQCKDAIVSNPEMRRIVHERVL